ncbi:RlpA-like double-psi beta-barrel-protein domain-containing protein-containing protein [Crucibulum laeve]|uniref:cellulase n=1 Tax=Crucibulum laeve TaxID=68775 RepID=A0A5C3LIT5_9AGAR|nr:RlpA-like double-psi beta-barrel-protein domain-containing protein-containing protein [Crucibulum laeve]
MSQQAFFYSPENQRPAIFPLKLAFFAAISLFDLVQGQTAGTTTTTWDCCGPDCGYTSNLSAGARGPVKSCNKSNDPAASGTQNACFTNGGNRNTATTTCCKCYQFTWTSGAAKGKIMIVQAINAGGITDIDFDIYTPGGGVGDFNACTAQYDAPSGGWGRQYGAVIGDGNKLEGTSTPGKSLSSKLIALFS